MASLPRLVLYCRGVATKNEVVRHFSHVDKCYALQEIVMLLTYVARLCMYHLPQ